MDLGLVFLLKFKNLFTQKFVVMMPTCYLSKSWNW